jgi:hypothetical protein
MYKAYIPEQHCNIIDKSLLCALFKGAFTLGVRDFSVESLNTMLVI